MLCLSLCISVSHLSLPLPLSLSLFSLISGKGISINVLLHRKTNISPTKLILGLFQEGIFQIDLLKEMVVRD